MTTKPKAIEAAAQIAASNPLLVLNLCLTTDAAVGGFEHTEFFLQLDQPTQAKMMAAKLETEAAVHRALSDGHQQVANVLKSGE